MSSSGPQEHRLYVVHTHACIGLDGFKGKDGTSVWVGRERGGSGSSWWWANMIKTWCIKILTNIIERRDSGLWPHLIRVQDTIMTGSSLSKECLTTEIVAMIVLKWLSDFVLRI